MTHELIIPVKQVTTRRCKPLFYSYLAVKNIIPMCQRVALTYRFPESNKKSYPPLIRPHLMLHLYFGRKTT